MFAIATDFDYANGGLVPLIKHDFNIVPLRAPVDYNPMTMVGSWDQALMQRVEAQNRVTANGTPRPAAIYFLDRS